MIEDSFIKMSKEEVIKRCEKTIRHIKTHRKDEENLYIQKKMNSINKSWLRKLFRRPQITFEETKGSCSDDSPGWISGYPSIYAWGTLDAAGRILRAAKASKDDVYLSSSDLYHIR